MGLFNKNKRVNSKGVAACESARVLMQTMEPRTLLSFTPGNLVVLRGETAASSLATAVTVVEYNTTTAAQASPVSSVALPTTAATTGNAAVTQSTAATSEGTLTRSQDGQYLFVTGYNATAGATGVAASAVDRAVGRIDVSGTVDSTTRVPGLSGNNIRSASSPDGSSIYVAGALSTTGLQLVTFGTQPTTANVIATGSSRAVNVVNGNVYVTQSTGLFQVGTGLPTSTATLAAVPGTTSSNYNYYFLDRDAAVAGVDELFIADGGNGLRKFSYNGATWAAQGVISGTFFGVAIAPNGTGTDIYAVTGTGGAAGNSLVKYTDTAAYNATATAGAVTTLATATGKVFRGVTFAPVTPPPSVTSLSSVAGTTAGGSTVTINGSAFTNATKVTFAGVDILAGNFVSSSATQITVSTPAHAAGGPFDVTVTTPAGISTTSAADQYTYTASPVVASLSVTSGPTAGGTSVVITGSNFTGATAVNFASTAATSFTVNSATQITATAPAGAGTVDVTVTAPGGSSSTSAADQFTYVAVPTLTSLSLASGVDSGGNLITITGTGFTTGTTVSFNSSAGNKPATSVTFVSSTSLTVKSPAFAAGTVADVVVTTAGGSSTVTGADKFTYGLTTIAGAETLPSGTAGVTIDSNPVITQILTLPGTVINAGGTKTYAAGGYSFFIQDATGSAEVFFTSTSTPLAGGYTPTVGDTVSVSGLWSPFNQIPEIGGTGANNVTSITKTGTASIPAPLANKAITDLSVTTLPSGIAGYIINLKGVNVSSITPAGTTTFGTASLKGVFSDTATTPHTLVMAYSAGSYTPFYNLGGTTIPTTSLQDVIGYMQEVTSAGVTTPQFVPLSFSASTAAPVVTGVSPAVGPTSGGNTVTINGYGFTGVTEVDFGSGNPATIVSNTDRQIVVTAPAGSLGSVDVAVITPNGGSAQSTSDTYTYSTVPFISGLSPNGGPLAGGTTVVISGVNFSGATAVSFGGTAAASFSVDPSGNSITAVTPAHIAGTVDITVTTPGGGTSGTGSTDKFTYAVPPGVTSLAPATGPTAGTTSVVITGTSFTGATGVSFGGIPATSFKITDDSHITAVAPGHVAGLVDVVVTNPGGASTVSSGDNYTYTATTIAAAESLPTGTVATLESNPVITAILSTPGTLNGVAYTTYSLTVNDGTGSAVVFGALPGGSTYVPTVGDTISVTGTWSPFHQIPELGTLTAISKTGTAAVPAPPNKTISQVKIDPLPSSIAGYLVTLHNVTISGAPANFGTANITATITDSSGNMTLFYWPSSYSSANAFFNLKAVPTNPVDLTGFVSIFTDTSVTPNVDTIEFSPISESPTVASTTSVASSANPATSGSNLTFTATVTPNATGTVTFLDGSTNLGTGTLSTTSGVTTATFTTSTPLSDGSHSITAVYGGDVNYLGSTSTILNQTVGASVPSWLSSNSAATWNSTSHILTVTGTATIIADPGLDAPAINASGAAAHVIFQAAVAPTTGQTFHLGGLTLTNGATADVKAVSSRSHGNHAVVILGQAAGSTVPTFTVDSASKFDLENNDLIVHHGNFTAINSSANLGRHTPANSAGMDGTWTGSGLSSSTAATVDTRLGYEQNALGVVVNNTLQSGTLANWAFGSVNEVLAINDVLVKYTYRGDFTLAGQVFDDAAGIFGGYYDNGVSSNNSWALGDVTGTGKLNDDAAGYFGGLLYGLGTGGNNGPLL